MKYRDLVTELQHKERTISDLVSYLKTRVSEQSPNYSFLLGAGASKSSGISTGCELVDQWREEIYVRESGRDDYSEDIAKKYFLQNGGAWYSPSNEYSSLFEKKYDLPAQRRRFVEQQVDRTLPSIGYSYLVSLTNPLDQYVNTIFTTNFDDLINESFYQFSRVRPLVCAHDSSVKSVSINSSRPKIIKLHGDYLFNDIKSTLRETESLEVNTKDKLIEFSKEYGMVVIGYSGSDRSIMDTLSYLLKTEDYLKNGVYWCLRENDEVNPELRQLLWKDRVYFVKVDGFDELLAEIHHAVKGPLSLKDNFSDVKKDLIVDSFSKDEYSLSKKSKLIRKDLDNLKKHKYDQDISNLIRDLAGTRSSERSGEFSENEFKSLLDIDHLFKCKKYQEARDQANSRLSDCDDDYLKSHYIKRLIEINNEMGDSEESHRLSDILIELDPFDSGYTFIKADLYQNLTKRCDYLKSRKKDFENSFSFLNRMVKEGYNEILHKPGNSVFDISTLISMNEKSIKLEPSPSNSAWTVYFDLLNVKYAGLRDKASEKEKKDCLDKHVSRIKSGNPDHFRVLELKVDRLSENNNIDEIMGLIDELKSVYLKSRQGKRRRLLELFYGVLMKLPDSKGDPSIYKKYYKDFIESEFYKDISLKNKNASIYLIDSFYNLNIQKDISKFEENLLKSITDLSGLYSSISYSFVLNSLCDVLKKYTLADQYLEDISDKVTTATYYYYKSGIELAKGNFDQSLEYIDKSDSYGFSCEGLINRRVFILLKFKKYEQVVSYIDLNSEVITSQSGKDTLQINRELAVKMAGKKVNEVALRNIVSRGISPDLVFAANCLLGHDVKAKRLMSNIIEREYSWLFTFRTWILIPDEFFNEFSIDVDKAEIKEKVAMV